MIGTAMVRTREDVLEALSANREGILRYGVRRLGLFGSFGRGEQTPASDLDFVAEFDRKSFDNYMGLKNFLEDLFGSKVDLVLPNTLKPGLRERILGQAIYAPGF